ncbi:MAG TPA: acyl-CoA dehydrogenase, partial [Ramlibacter sp.]
EETGAAQYLRDAKILTIYEGTTAIQANDLVGRKTARDGGQVAKAIAEQVKKTEAELAEQGSDDAKAVLAQLSAAREAFVKIVEFVAGQTKASPNAVFAGSVPYLMAAGKLVAGWQLARSLLIAQKLAAEGQDLPFMKAKVVTARFYAEHILNGVPAAAQSIVEGAASVTALPVEAF